MTFSVKKEDRSPLARLVLFMVCLAIAASFVAGVHYAAIDLPQQEFAAHPPTNSQTCYVVDWWTALWRMIFGIGSCGSSQGANMCCDD